MCNCRQGVKRGQPMRVGQVRPTSMPRNALELRRLAAKKTIDKELANKENTSGGLDKNRREIERRRRLILLQKLGRL